MDMVSKDLSGGKWLAKLGQDADIVISGMSGGLPNSKNVVHFMENLLNKVDLCDENTRIPYEEPDVPKLGGRIPDIELFDNGYFGVHSNQAKHLDPSIRVFLEKVAEAIFDAGLHPDELRYSKTGVFTANCGLDYKSELKKITTKITACVTGAVNGMISAQVCYFFGFDGPTKNCDSACSSSLYAIDEAYQAILMGKCDRAIVGGIHISLSPFEQMQFNKLGVLNMDTGCRPFDRDANGYTRSEAVVALLLEKRSTAKRVYGHIVHCKTNNDGFKEQGITFPSVDGQMQLLRDVYLEANVDPKDVGFVEAHGTGTKAGDPVELTTLAEFYKPTVRAPLLIGSVKGNMGHAEPAAATGSVVKVLTALNCDCIAPNIHYDAPREGIPALEENRLKVITDITPFPKDKKYIGINSFGFGGANGHLLMAKYNKTKDIDLQRGYPLRLICYSSRTEEGMGRIHSAIQNFNDVESLRLLQESFVHDYDGHLYRGFTIAGSSVHSYSKISRKKLYIILQDFTENQQIKCISKIPLLMTTLAEVKKELDPSRHINLSILKQLILLKTFKELKIQTDSFEDDDVSKTISAYLKNNLCFKSLVKYLNSIANNNCIQNINNISINYGGIATIIAIGDGKFMLPKYLAKKCNIIRFDAQQSDEDFMYNIGKIFEAGYNPVVYKLNEHIDFPVSCGTKCLSPLVHWKHKPIWMPQWGKSSKFKEERFDSIVVDHADTSYLRGHLIDNRNLFPATGYLYHIWMMFADNTTNDIKDCSVVFENIKFWRASSMTKSVLELYLTLHKDGVFEISDNGAIVVSGQIMALENSKSSTETFISSEETVTNVNRKFVLCSKDVYRELRLRGYNYKSMFRAIQEASPGMGKISWEDNWVTFMDNMLQLSILELDTRNLFVPVGIDRIEIRPKEHINYVNELEEKIVPVFYCSKSKTISSKFIQIRGLNAQPIARRKDRLKPVLESYQFIPNEITTDLPTSMRINMQILLENKKTLTYKVVEFLRAKEEPVIGHICNVIEDMPLVLPDMTIVSPAAIEMENVNVQMQMTNQNLLFVCQYPDHQLLLEAQKALIPDGFLLCLCDAEFLFDNNFTLLTKHTIEDQRIVYFLRRKLYMEKKTMIVEVSDSEELVWVQKVQDTMETSDDVILFAQDNYKTGVLGLTNCLTKEPGIDNIRCILNQDSKIKFDINKNDDVLYKQLRKDMVVNVYKNGQWGTYRHLLLEENKKVSAYHWYGSALSPGDLSSTKWVKGPITPENQHIFKPHKVVYSAINFRDLMIASGKLVGFELGTDRANAWSEGLEYAGYDMNGKRVFGFAKRAIANLVVPITSMEIPNGWEMDEAATVFVVYLTLIRGIQQIAEISKGKSILIHSGTGGIGLAALNMCTYFECDIFVTVGTKEKREYLLKNYPNLNPSHIGNSRDSNFKQMVLRETNGRGVDIALNSLADDKLQATVECLSPGGMFIEIGKYDLQRNSQLSKDLAMKQCTFHGAMLDSILVESDTSLCDSLVELLKAGIKKGYVKPLPRTVFQVDELEKAFKYMSAGTHIGKILIKIDHERDHKVISRFYCDPAKSYIIFGGLGGFGLELADWLILRGARHLILSSRRGVTTGYQKYRINIWKSYGIKVSVLTEDVTNFEKCSNALMKIHAETPIDGVFNLALVLKDSLWTAQNAASMKTSMTPKSILTDHLDKVTRKICPLLRYFVVFSSVSCGRGNAGQTNYGFSNSIMERICELRHADGLPALAVQWGAVGDVGILEEMQRENNEIAIGGTLQQKVRNCLEVFDQLIIQNHPVVSSIVVAEKFEKGSANTPLDTVCLILGVNDAKAASRNATLPELGMDSMMAVEIKQALERDFDIILGPNDLKRLTLVELANLNEGLSKKENHIENSKVPEWLFAGQTIPIEDLNIEASTCEGDFVIALPGIDATISCFQHYANLAKIHFKVVNYNAFSTSGKDIDIFVNYLFHELYNDVVAYKSFKIVAHSFGGLIAIELTKLFENNGIKGLLVLLDSAPELVYFVSGNFFAAKNQKNSITEDYFSALVPKKAVNDFKKILEKGQDIDSQMEKLIDEFIKPKPDVKISLQRSLVNFASRMYCCSKYKERVHLKLIESKVILYKPTTLINENMDVDYKLKEICTHIDKIDSFEGNHLTFLTNEKLTQQLFKDLNV